MRLLAKPAVIAEDELLDLFKRDIFAKAQTKISERLSLPALSQMTLTDVLKARELPSWAAYIEGMNTLLRESKVHMEEYEEAINKVYDLYCAFASDAARVVKESKGAEAPVRPDDVLVPGLRLFLGNVQIAEILGQNRYLNPALQSKSIWETGGAGTPVVGRLILRNMSDPSGMGLEMDIIRGQLDARTDPKVFVRKLEAGFKALAQSVEKEGATINEYAEVTPA
jgi:hypothetical protein